MTCSSGGAIDAVVDFVERAGRGGSARRAACRWASRQPALACFGSPAEAAAACRNAGPHEQDVLLGALLALTAGDQWAQLCVLAGVAGRLRWVVAGWARAGMPVCELADAEAELVACCWTVVAAWGGQPPPARPGLALVDVAWEEVRAGRRRGRRQPPVLPLPAELPAAAVGRPGLEVLAAELSATVAAGRLALAPARSLYLTRVAGLSTAEAAQRLGCGPGVVRVWRSRAARALAA